MLHRSVNGRTYYGVAKEKAEAEQEFEERISAGENAGLVQSRSLCSHLHNTSHVCTGHILQYCKFNTILLRWNLLQRQKTLIYGAKPPCVCLLRNIKFKARQYWNN